MYPSVAFQHKVSSVLIFLSVLSLPIYWIASNKYLIYYRTDMTYFFMVDTQMFVNKTLFKIHQQQIVDCQIKSKDNMLQKK